MHNVLIVMTALSLALAAGMALVIVKLLGEDRERSEARVAALTAMAEVSAEAPVDSRVEAPGEPELRPAPAGAGAGAGLFAPHDNPSPWGRRFAVIGALAAVLVAVAFVATAGHGTPNDAAAQVAAPVDPGNMPLELLALRHSRDAQNLTISGTVHNPKNAAPLARLVATAFLFGPDGAFLTSSRAPLDITTLAPGEESPFVVKVPVSGDVSRYRISFRTEDGRVVGHVDKRSPDTLASKQEQP
jgi:hypothetical protein